VKKAISLFLLSVFLLSVPGLAYSLHFCGEMLMKSGISAEAKKACVCDKQQSEDDCCKDQQVDLSVDDSKQSAFDYKLDTPKLTLLSAVVPQLLLQLFAPTFKHSSFFELTDIPILKVPVYLFIGSFLI
jgi:hypothetical protein